jgi:phosphoribosylcarboxyaminoimidazole (NCAIR) mutase
VPVAAVAINNSINAALLAARIIGTADAAVRSRIEKYAADMEKGVVEKAEKLEMGGWKTYSSEK